MKKILSIPIIALLLFGLLVLPGCDGEDFSFDLKGLSQSLFNTAIDQAIQLVETELIGEDRDENVEYLTNLIEGWLEPLGVLDSPDAEGWEEVIANAFDTVMKNLAPEVKEKLEFLYPETWEYRYEGADTSAIGVVDHDDFQGYYDEVVAPLY